MSTKTLAKTEKMCYNTFRVPVFRLYRSGLVTSVQGRRTCDTAACLFYITIIPQLGNFVNGFLVFCLLFLLFRFCV